MSNCNHFHLINELKAPLLSQSVHREECTQCFDDQDGPSGIDVCLSCFNGGCLDTTRRHAHIHAQKYQHPFTLNIKRRPKPSPQRSPDEDQPPAKMTKLAIIEESEKDKFDHSYAIKCWICNPQRGQELPNLENPQISKLVEEVKQSMSSGRQSEVKAWEEEILPCEHTLTLQPLATKHVPASQLAHCSSCDLKENLWLCMVCGSLNCGRAQYGGVGGNGHGLAHHEATGHGVSVKLGTITPEGAADVYCYVCNDAKLDPELASHLATFGINVQGLKKTEKSMTELQIEHNLNYDFSLTDEDGNALEPVFGPGLTGLSNLGNSCYMASTLQTLFALPAFQQRYYNRPLGTSPSSSAAADDNNDNDNNSAHALTCSSPLPADCLECQMLKMGDGLLSGRYSRPASFIRTPVVSGSDDANSNANSKTTTPQQQQQAGIKPTGFKRLVGKGHGEFGTMRQQDSEEFLVYLVECLRRDERRRSGGGGGQDRDATRVFSYATEQRLQCADCKRVRYRNDTADVLGITIPARPKSVDGAGAAGADEHKMNVDTPPPKVEYEEVGILECIEAGLGVEALEYECEGCGKKVHALKRSRFASFPEVLVVHAKKFQLVNWVPAKLDVPVILPPDDILEFDDRHLGKGIQPDEVELPTTGGGGAAASQGLVFNEGAMAQLEGMGFPTVRCQRALLATGNSADAEVAMNWLFEHMEDPDIDLPIDPSEYGGGQQQQQQGGGGGGAIEPTPDQIAMLADMGFTTAQAKKALRETNGDIERAVEWLFSHPFEDGGNEENVVAPSSATTTTTGLAAGPGEGLPGSTDVPVRYRLKAFISHKGPSVHSGHYVAHIRKTLGGAGGKGGDGEGEEWVFFNDEKVVKAEKEGVDELKKLAYVYVFERVV